MGDERAQTYLRLLAEQQARASPRSGPDIARSVERVRSAGEILASAGLVEESDVHRVAGELEAALLVRSDLDRPRYARRIGWALAALADLPRADRWWWGDAAPVGITPIGRTISVAHERAPSELHLMSLVRSPRGMVITAALRVRWPSDGSCADLEITGAGPHLLPYDQLRATDDRGSHYRVVLSGEGGDLTWQGAIGLPGVPPSGARWLDLIADGTQRLIRIELNPADLRPAAAAEPAPAVPPGERVLTLAAERILASAWDQDGPSVDARLDETITVLIAAGALPVDSPVPGQLAALCRRLEVPGAPVSAAPAVDLPARWAEVLPGESPGAGPEWFVPLGPAVADLADARFVLAGLATAGGQSFLHVVATGMAPQPIHGPDTGLSWWVRDGAGHWHLGLVSDPHALQPSLAMGFETAPFRLRLTPPLRARPDHLEVVVTGRTARARVVVPVGTDREMPDT
ncbi:MAG: hypothetical protein ACRDP5_25925 [Streptosporangiaceae bacterium]